MELERESNSSIQKHDTKQSELLGSPVGKITAKVGCSELKMGPRQKSWRKILHAFPRDAHNTLTRSDLHKIFWLRTMPAGFAKNGQEL